MCLCCNAERVTCALCRSLEKALGLSGEGDEAQLEALLPGKAGELELAKLQAPSRTVIYLLGVQGGRRVQQGGGEGKGCVRLSSPGPTGSAPPGESGALCLAWIGHKYRQVVPQAGDS